MIDSTKQKLIQADLQKAYDDIAAKHGLSLQTRVDVRRDRAGNFCRVMKLDMYTIQASAVKKSMFGTGSEVPPPSKKDDASRNPALARAMARHNINYTGNSKGDTLTSFYPNSPKFCFGYTSGRGTEWKCSAEQAQKRFG